MEACVSHERFDETIDLKLQRDEAIVLFWYLSRELDKTHLDGSFIHPAEAHSLHALLQELISSADRYRESQRPPESR